MRTLLLLALFALAACRGADDETAPRPAEGYEAFPRFELQRGVNISHWLSQSRRRGAEREAYFQAEDVSFIAGQGFDHLRIPVDEEQLWNEAGEKEPEAWELLHQGFAWCRDNGLRAIVDLHILRSHHFNEDERPLWTQPEAQDRFLACWTDLSEALRDYPVEFMAYELMNEPVADDPEDWNALVAKAVAHVRQWEPERKILIGSNRWQSTETFGDLSLPPNDTNLIVSFHFYEPFLLTHHQASWTDIAFYDGPVQYPGQLVAEEDLAQLQGEERQIIARRNRVVTRESLAERIARPIAFARARNLPVYCGEWGCLDTVEENDRLQWYEDVRSILEANDVAWTIWDYKGSFGIRTGDGQAREELIAVLTD